MEPLPPKRIAAAWLLLEAWVLLSAWLSLGGWLLSICHALGAAGYALVLGLGLAAGGAWLRRRIAGLRVVWSAPRKRRRPQFLLFLAVLTLAGLGGLLYPPTNYDALTYRVPPVLHWLAAGRWHWVATSNALFNLNPPGFGWLIAPMLALLKSDRLFFLVNVISLAVLPAAFFTVLRGCGAGRRASWYWMWLLPTGYCFALQAGGIGNDLLPAAYLLGAVALAVRAVRTSEVGPLWLSMLAVALGTGVKVIVLPLVLVWLVAGAPAWRLALARKFGTLAVATVAACVSFLPTAALNVRYTGDWSGDPTNFFQIRIANPVYGVLGNAFELAAGNVAPPVAPLSATVNRAFQRFEASPFGQALRRQYSRFDLNWGDLAIEESAGLGPGLGGLAIVTLCAAILLSGRGRSGRRRDHGLWVSLAAVVAMLAFCGKMGSESAPRLAAPYYPFILIPFLRSPANDWLTRRRWWRILAALTAASVLAPLVLMPARPLWPAQRILTGLAGRHPQSAALQRASLIYSVYAHRDDALEPLKPLLPPDTRLVGFVPTGNDLEGSLWKPYGTRHVIEVLEATPSDPAIRQLRGSAVVTSRRGLRERFGLTPETFAAAIGGHIAGTVLLAQKAAIGPEEWVVIGVDAASAKVSDVP